MADVLDLGSRPVEGGYFLRRLSGVPARFEAARPRSDGQNDYRHCFTYWESDRTVREAAIETIEAAQRKVFLASYLIGDDELHQALVAAAQRLVGGVYVITQVDPSRLRRGLADLGELSDDPRADLEALKKRFDKMTTQGIYVRGHPDCHAKFIVVDDEIALVSSANLMTSAFDRTGENGVIITDQGEAERLARLFARLWHRGCPREARPGRSYKLSKVPQDASNVHDVTVPQPMLDGRAEIIWTDGDDHEHHILKTLHDVVNRAKDELLLASFSLVGMRQHRRLLLDQVVAAVERGVRVRLLIRPRRNKDDHMADASALAEAGVEIRADTETHMKGVIADRRHGALFSANFDSQHGLTSGVEVGARLDGTAALHEAHRLFEHALDQATLQFVVRPSHDVLARGLDIAGRVPWPLDSTITVTATPEHRTRFVKAVADGPVLFTNPSDRRITLHAGRTLWHLVTDRPDGHLRLRPAPPNGAQSSGHTLKDWLTQPTGAPRGVCRATFKWVNNEGGRAGT